jgi:hypothetical protein
LSLQQEKDILAQQVENLHKVVNNLKTVIEEKDEELTEMMSAMTPVAAGPVSLNYIRTLDVEY